MSRRFGRNQRRKMRERIDALEHQLHAGDELLEALEDVIGLAFSLEEVQNKYIPDVVSEYIAGDIENLIARVKGGAV